MSIMSERPGSVAVVNLLLCLMLLALILPKLSATDAASSSELEARIDAYVQDIIAAGAYPAVAVSVRQGDTLVYHAAQGFADLEHQVPASADTVFRIGSLTKSFTSLLLARLAVEGKLDLELPVATYLPAYAGPAGEVPVRKLMNHTAGLLNYTDLPEFPHAYWGKLTREQMVAMFADADLVYAPGSEFLYSNSGTYLLGLIAEAVTGDDYATALQQWVLDPLQLADTSIGDREALIPRRARGYAATESGFVNAPWLYPLIPFSAGALTSTLSDMQRYIQQVHEAAVFGEDVSELIAHRSALPEGPLLNYTQGALIDRDRLGRRQLGHPGAIDGFSSYLTWYPDDALSIVVFTNAGASLPDPIAIEQRIARMVLGVPRLQPSNASLTADELNALTGDYLPGRVQMGLPSLGIVAHEQGELAVRLGGMHAPGESVPLQHVAGRHFMAAHDESMEFRFEPESGPVTSLELDWYGALLPYSPTPNP